MNWEAIGALGELLGAIAVVLTLAYLARQVQLSNIAAKVSAKQEISRQYMGFSDLLLQNPEVFRVFIHGLQGNDLSEDDALLFSTLLGRVTWHWSSMFYQREAQSLTEAEWHQSRALIEQHVGLPGYQLWWQERKERFEPGFVEYLDRIAQGTEMLKAGDS